MRALLFVSLVLSSLAAYAQEVPPPITAPQNISQVQSQLIQSQLKHIGAIIPPAYPGAGTQQQRNQEVIERYVNEPARKIARQNQELNEEQLNRGAPQPNQKNHTDDFPNTAPNPYPMATRFRAPSLDPDRHNKVQFGQFAPSTESARKLEKMYLGKEEDMI